MSLLSRLVDPAEGEVKLRSHQFMAALAELKRGEVTRAQVVAAFGLSASEETQLDTFIDNHAGTGSKAINREEIHDALLLGEAGHYTLAQVKARLGV
jgi:hypothetical protein